MINNTLLVDLIYVSLFIVLAPAIAFVATYFWNHQPLGHPSIGHRLGNLVHIHHRRPVPKVA